MLAEDGVSTSRGAHEEGIVGGMERTLSWRHVWNGHESVKQGTCGVESASGSGQGRIMQVDPPTDPPATLDPPEPVALPQTREESQDEKGN